MYDVYTGGSINAVKQAATYYGASMSAASQCISVANTFQLTSTDGFATVNWYDTAGAGLSGNSAYWANGNALMSCAPGTDKPRALAVRADTGAAVFSGSAAALLVSNNKPFQTVECVSGVVTPNLTQLAFGVDQSATVTDSTGGNTSFSAAQVQQAFGAAGLTLGNGTVIRWTLYLEPVGALIQQVIVHTASKPDGSVNVFAFRQN